MRNPLWISELVWLFTEGFGSYRCRVLMLTPARMPIERTRKDRRGENRRLYNLRESFFYCATIHYIDKLKIFHTDSFVSQAYSEKLTLTMSTQSTTRALIRT